jgi:hypothetical protein
VVETTQDGKPVRLKLRRVTSFCGHAISGFAKSSLGPDCAVVSDGLQCIASVTDARMLASGHQDRLGPQAARTPAFKRVNTASGQHQVCDCRNLLLHQQQACATLPRRVRIPLQPAIRSRSHDSTLIAAAIEVPHGPVVDSLFN